MDSIKEKVEELIPALFSGTLDDEERSMLRQEELAQLVTPPKAR